MKLVRIALLSLATASVLVAGKVSGSTLYGGTLTGGDAVNTLFVVDQNTGARTPIASGGFGFEDLTSDWRAESYRVWGLSTDGVQRTLELIDPASGHRTNIGALSTIIRSLAFDVTTETLFGAAFDGLYKIDVNTAGVTFIGGSGGIYPFDALGSDLAGNLFGYYRAFPPIGVARIDKTTGTFQVLSPTGTPGIWLTDLAVRPEDGVLLGVGDVVFGQNKLYEVNTTTGALTPLGSAPFQRLTGLAFSPAVPEPSTFVLVTATLAMPTARCRSFIPRSCD